MSFQYKNDYISYLLEKIVDAKSKAMSPMDYLDEEEENYSFKLAYKSDPKYKRYNSNVILVSDNEDTDNDLQSTISSINMNF